MDDRVAYHAAGAAPQSIESSTSAAPAPAAVSAGTEAARSKSRSAVTGLTFPRFFTEAGVDPFDELEWESRSAIIGN